ncbi:MAG TPA: helicase-related protein, partial [Gemmatimonadales bacterium]
EPLVTALRLGPLTSPARVAAALARSLAPEEAEDIPPAWLWPEQRVSFRRAVGAIRRHGGALLADPVGAGKTYVALAVAAVCTRRPTACMVPAAVVDQWRAVAETLGVPVVVWSHERASRGALPARCGPLVLIDESHHYRNPGTRRYRTLAPWLVGRQALLVSATPVVNRLDDLAHQLALTLRDDVLRPQGVPSLAGLLHGRKGHPALGQVVITRPSRCVRRPGVRARTVQLDNASLAPLAGALALVERLRLSSRPPIAALIRAGFWRAAASSAPALEASLRRYQRLLLHAQDARRSGRVIDRRLLRELTGGLDDQLLLWELLDSPDETTDLVPDDLPVLEELRALLADATSATDPKLDLLRDLLVDGRVSLVFTVARETVRHIRDRLAGPVAWCTGERAGIGRHATSRSAVLGWFRPDRVMNGPPSALAPRQLVTTDVTAEGLDLHRAERVIHYDLPWTPARMDQREGRARRGGALHADVEVIQFEPPPDVEDRLRQLTLLARKRELPKTAGLGESGAELWRWRGDLAERFLDRPADEGVAFIPCGPPGFLAGFSLHGWPTSAPLATFVGWWDAEAGWTEAPDVLAERLEAAARVISVERSPPTATDAALARVAEQIRLRMRELRCSRWLGPHAAPAAHRLVTRLQQLARAAARRRDAAALERLHRAIRFTAGGHTAGERTLVALVAGFSDRSLETAVSSLPLPAADWEAIHARLTGVIVFG